MATWSRRRSWSERTVSLESAGGARYVAGSREVSPMFAFTWLACSEYKINQQPPDVEPTPTTTTPTTPAEDTATTPTTPTTPTEDTATTPTTPSTPTTVADA